MLGIPSPHTVVAGDLNTIYHELLAQILAQGVPVQGVLDPYSIGSGFGRHPRPFLEIIPSIAVLQNPRQRWVWNQRRRVSFVNAVGQWFWLLGGSNDLASIEFYNRKAADFSDDGRTLRGAWGYRIFGNSSSLYRLVGKLRDDPSSRRIVLPVFIPEDALENSRNLPCLLHIQFLVRGNRLLMVSVMRSNSALMVLPYDFFVLTMLHELVSLLAKFQQGPYIHIAHSMHIYEDEIETARSTLESDCYPTHPMPPMPEDTDLDLINSLAECERKIRISPDFSASENLIDKFPEYWANLLRITYAHKCLLHSQEQLAHKTLERLTKPFIDMYRCGQTCRSWDTR